MPLSPEDLAAVGELITAQFNARDEAAPPITADVVKAILTEQITGLDLGGQITAATKKLVDDAKAESDRQAADKKPAGKGDPEVLRQQAEMQKKIDELDAARSASAERERVAVANERETTISTELGRALSDQGIAPDRHAQVLPYLRSLKSAHSGKPVVSHDDTGKLVWLEAGEGYDTSRTVAAGVEAWAKTDAAKVYRPPVDHRGAGTGGGRRPAGGAGRVTTTAQVLGTLVI